MPNASQPEFMTKLSYLSAKASMPRADKVDLSRRIAALVYNSVPEENLMLGALVSLCLWDPSPKRCRFTCDAFANSKHPWAGKVFSQRGITDPSAAWQLKRRNQLAKLPYEKPAKVADPLSIRLLGDTFAIGDKVFSYDDEGLFKLLENAISLANSADFSFSETIIEMRITDALDQEHAKFLSKLAKVSRFLPISPVTIAESPHNLKQAFDMPTEDFGDILWFIQEPNRSFSHLGIANTEFPSPIPTDRLSNLTRKEVITLPANIRFHRLKENFKDILDIAEIKAHFSPTIWHLSGEADWTTKVDSLGRAICRQ